MEDQKTLENFVKYFGDKFYNYLIILFTMKDDLDDEGVELMDKLKTVSDELKALITKCGGRVIAFNNRLKGEQQNAQVTELLSMILKNIKSNEVEYYTYEMYFEAAIQLIKREEEMMIKEKMKWEKWKKEYEEIEKRLWLNHEIASKFAKEAKREKKTHRQCKSLLMKKPGEEKEEKEEIHRRNAEDELKVKTELTSLDLGREMILKNLEENRTKMKEETEKEYLNKRNTVPNAVRTDIEHLEKEFEQAEVQHEDDFLTMAVNTAKSWWS